MRVSGIWPLGRHRLRHVLLILAVISLAAAIAPIKPASASTLTIDDDDIQFVSLNDGHSQTALAFGDRGRANWRWWLRFDNNDHDTGDDSTTTTDTDTDTEGDTTKGDTGGEGDTTEVSEPTKPTTSWWSTYQTSRSSWWSNRWRQADSEKTTQEAETDITDPEIVDPIPQTVDSSPAGPSAASSAGEPSDLATSDAEIATDNSESTDVATASTETNDETVDAPATNAATRDAATAEPTDPVASEAASIEANASTEPIDEPVAPAEAEADQESPETTDPVASEAASIEANASTEPIDEPVAPAEAEADQESPETTDPVASEDQPAARGSIETGGDSATADELPRVDELAGYSGLKHPGSMYNVVDQINAREAWDQGITGAGVQVAVIDTGVAPVASLNSPGKVVALVDFSLEAHVPEAVFLDTNGHGSHIAGIIAGRSPEADTRAADGSEFLGVAPNASIVSVKVGDNTGAVDVTQVIAAIDWVVDNRNADGLNIRVINLSYGTDGTQDYVVDPLSFAVERAWAAGIVVVVAAGNEGWTAGGLSNPARDPFVISVGAAEATETGMRIPKWTSTSPLFVESAAGAETETRWDDLAGFWTDEYGARMPDIVAPGASIESLRVPGSRVAEEHPEGYVTDYILRGSGSSQATAVVSGAVALLLEARPYLTPDEVKALLRETATDIPWALETAQGRGLIDVGAALYASVPSDSYQDWERSTGLGSLQAARGSQFVTVNGVDIIGEITVAMKAWDPGLLIQLSAAGASWSGASWSGASWSGASWSGASWSGASWSGASWSGASWSGASWSGASWSGASWSGASWSGASWSGASWSGASWSGASWSGEGWHGAVWT